MPLATKGCGKAPEGERALRIGTLEVAAQLNQPVLIPNLYAGLPNVRAWRRFLSEQSGQEAANADVMLQALRLVRQVA